MNPSKSYTHYQKQKIIQAADQIDMSIKKDDYITVSKILKNTEIAITHFLKG
ncbi:hypothetical protein [Neobacillus cucumis]|uniref:hypothetical protein n=1 Tax=Neobacillus cucumis TaxID=1740721 RepID=UPI002E1B094D|nr:hypothetical protein [Neobacillus cucumis]